MASGSAWTAHRQHRAIANIAVVCYHFIFIDSRSFDMYYKHKASLIWAYVPSSATTLVAIAALFEIDIKDIIAKNLQLHDFKNIHSGVVVFIPTSVPSDADFDKALPALPPSVRSCVKKYSPHDAASIRSKYFFSDINNSDTVVDIDPTLLQHIMDKCAGTVIKSKLDLAVVADALNRAMDLADANNRRREVGFLSQAVIETDYFRTFEEYGKGSGKEYGKFYGRGMHQLTWEETYKKCSNDTYNDDRLVKNPDLVTKDINVNIDCTAWYWRDYKPFNDLSDKKDIAEIIHRLYGGTSTSKSASVRNSVSLRKQYYATIVHMLNLRYARII